MPYLSEVILDNFQSHAHTVLNFSNGFNCIVGKSRSGKTSIVRAMMFMYFDEWTESFIRKGATHVTVTFKFDDGTSVIRSKGGVVNKIEVLRQDGTSQPFENFGIKAPPAVKDVLRVAPVRIDIDKFININISDQDAPPFLLSETAPSKTKYLNRLTGAHILDAALRTLNKDKLAYGAIQENCTVSLKKLNKDAEKCDNLPMLKQQFSMLYEKNCLVKSKLEALKSVISVRNKLKELNERLDSITQKSSIVSTALNETLMLKTRFQYLINLKKLKSLFDREHLLCQTLQTNNIKLNELNAMLTICPTCGTAGIKETFNL